jgi:hypothetical protein
VASTRSRPDPGLNETRARVPGAVESGHIVAGTFRVGSLVFDIRGPVAGYVERLTSLPRFATTTPADVHVVIDGVDMPSPAAIPEGVRLARVDASERLVRMDSMDWTATFDLRHGTVAANLVRDRSLGLDSLLRTALQLFCLERRSGVLFHASAVELDGRSYVFSGPSGAGKTTAAYLSARVGARVLAEEIVYVGLDSPEAYVGTLPFHQRDGATTRPESVPLCRFYQLEQALSERVVDLRPARQVMALTATATIGLRHAVFMERAFELCEALASRTTVKRLEFRASPDFWQAIDSDVKGGTHEDH